MATPVAKSYSGTGTLAAGRISVSPYQVRADGIWTWLTDPRAVCYNGATYVGCITSLGDAVITKFVHATGVSSSFVLHSTLQVDDHNNVAVMLFADGRIGAFYCAHNDAGGHRYRVSTNPEDITAWGGENVLSLGITLPVSYSNPQNLYQDQARTWLFFRSGGGGGTSGLAYKTTADLNTWTTQVDVWKKTGVTPYYVLTGDDKKRFHFAATDLHPVEGQSSIYHFYMELDATNTPKWYRSDGTLITPALPIATADATRVYDGTTVRGWVWDIAIGVDGNPRILGTRYPANNGTDIRYMHWAWDGYAWQQTEITSDGPGLYSPEVYYAGGICFDGDNPDIVYLSRPDAGGVRQIEEWRIANNGASWTKFRSITTGGTLLNARPFSPKNHSRNAVVLWWNGTYTSFNSYNTNINAAGR